MKIVTLSWKTGGLPPWYGSVRTGYLMEYFPSVMKYFQVLDRICLIFFTAFTCIATVTVLTTAPHVIVN